MIKNNIKIFLVDDHQLLRDGVKFLINKIEHTEVIGEASNGLDFLRFLEENEIPEITFMDISMPKMDGIEACIKANEKFPGIKIIALSMNDEPEYYYKMIKAGARGFVPKNSDKEKLKNAIKEVSSGGSFFPEDILRNIIFKFETGDSVENKLNDIYKITKREKEVLSLICCGYTNTEIAEKLFLSTKTIEGHRSNLFSKTGTKNAAHLVMFAVKTGIIKI